jgi:NADH dehydrogenase FAD-containing subunit
VYWVYWRPIQRICRPKRRPWVERLGVEVMKGVMVTGVNGDGVTYNQGPAVQKLAAKAVLWAEMVMTASSDRKSSRTRLQAR